MWNSVSCESNDKEVDFFSHFPTGPGITIGKERSLRRYVFDNNSARSTKWIKNEEHGLNSEITKLTSRNTNWWSIGFEGFGDKHSKEESSYFLGKILKDFPISRIRRTLVSLRGVFAIASDKVTLNAMRCLARAC
jgi:hypothetical protein